MLCSPELLDAIDQTVDKSIDTLDAQHKVFAECFSKLSARNKDLIERRYQPGATPRTVAEQIGRNVNAVYQALARIHNSLFDCVRKATLGRETS
jgi:RNA polymerase sigma-70 factor (ECF subfamily)